MNLVSNFVGLIIGHPFASTTLAISLVGVFVALFNMAASVRPEVEPRHVDREKHTITLGNTGRGSAETIGLIGYSQYIDFGNHFRFVSLEFPHKLRLAANQTVDVPTDAYENGIKLKGGKDLIFSYFLPSQYEKNKRAAILIEYKDIHGRGYVTRGYLQDGQIVEVNCSRDLFPTRWARHLSLKGKAWAIKMWVWLIQRKRTTRLV